MKKLLFMLLLIVCVGGIYFYFTAPQQIPNSPVQTTSSTVGVPPPSIREVIDPTSGGVSFYKPFSIKNAVTGDIITFKNFKGSNSANDTADIYVNGKMVGPGSVGGVDLLESSFSPDNHYFAMLFPEECGVTTYCFELDAIDLTNTGTGLIRSPMMPETYPGNTSGFSNIMPIMESYTWSSDDTLDIVAYTAGSVYDQQHGQVIFYRISPKDTWKFDLSNKQYTLIQTIASSTGVQ